MSFVAGLPPLVGPAAFMDTAREEINALPAPKYVIPSFTPSSFPEEGRGVQSHPRFQSLTRIADSTAEADVPTHLPHERGNNV
ncbi:MAG: hypothetical protein WBW16_09665 [Bacteroidota bacterium]